MVRGVWPLGRSRGRLGKSSNCCHLDLGDPLMSHAGAEGMVPRGVFLHPLPHLAMLHSGSMRCTRGSSMYSNCRLLSTRARSTLTETGTGPRPLEDGGETHTISFIDRLMGRQQEGCENRHGKRGVFCLERGFPVSEGVTRTCPWSEYTVYYGTRPYRCLSVPSLPETQLWFNQEGANWRRGLTNVRRGLGFTSFTLFSGFF